jgi:hypothetical protein
MPAGPIGPDEFAMGRQEREEVDGKGRFWSDCRINKFSHFARGLILGKIVRVCSSTGCFIPETLREGRRGRRVLLAFLRASVDLALARRAPEALRILVPRLRVLRVPHITFSSPG